MLILADLLIKSDKKTNRPIILKSITEDEAKREQIKNLLESTLHHLRITAETEVILRDEGTPVVKLIAERSQNAALVLMDLAVPDQNNIPRFYRNLRQFSDTLPSVLFVRNNNEDLPYE